MFLSICGNSCFFLDTTPSKNIMLSDNSLLNALSTVLLFSPNAIICELLFNMSVIANTNKVNLFFSISSFIAFSNSSFLFSTSSILTVFTCAITNFSPFFSRLLASKLISSSAEKSSKSVPAFNISNPYSSTFIFAIFPSSSSAFLSYSVVVGDFNNSVSDIIALAIRIASVLSISCPRCLNSSNNIAGFKGPRTKDVVFDENTLYFDQEFESNPYLVSKFEAEKAVLYATNYKRLNAAIFRIGNIMPRYEDGLFQQNATQNVFLLAMKSILDCKMIPKEFYNTSLEFSPVDECSKLIVSLIAKNSPRTVFHILNNNEISIFELTTLLNGLGCGIVETDFDTFKNNLINYTDEYTKEYLLGQNLNSYSQDFTLRDLADLHLAWHKTDAAYLQKVIDVIKSL